MCYRKLRVRMSNWGLKAEHRIHPDRLNATLSMEPLIHERPRRMEGVCETTQESECARVTMCLSVWGEEIYANGFPRCGVWNKLQILVFMQVATSARMWFPWPADKKTRIISSNYRNHLSSPRILNQLQFHPPMGPWHHCKARASRFRPYKMERRQQLQIQELKVTRILQERTETAKMWLRWPGSTLTDRDL